MAKRTTERDVSARALRGMVHTAMGQLLEAFELNGFRYAIMRILAREEQISQLPSPELAKALNELRRTGQIEIEFDGENDRLSLRISPTDTGEVSAQDKRME